jgi:uncharacterized protein YqgC (DUF456 family)
MPSFFAWFSLILGFVLASIGTIAPGVPGALFVVIGIFIHKLLLPGVFSWWIVTLICVLALISWFVDFFAGVWGARLGGATRMGVLGAAIGGLCGVFFGIPGLLLGPFLGAVIGDILAKRRDLIALFKSGSGAASGYIISIITRIFILVIMLITVFLGSFF